MRSPTIPTPYEAHFVVRPEWLDPNGHMNVAYYLAAFDEGSNPFFDDAGIGWDYTRAGEGTVFMVGCNLDFRREVFAGNALRVITQLIDWNEKLVHVYKCMYQADEGYLAAVSEAMFMHIAFATRRSAPFPAATQSRLAEVARAHAPLGRPAGLGRPLAIRRPSAA